MSCRALAIVAVLAGVAHADTPSPHEVAFRRAEELFDRHEWAAARAAYLIAYQIEPRPIALFNIATTYRREHDRSNERLYYQRYLDAAGPDAEASAAARERIAEIDAAPPATGYPSAAILRPPVLPAGVASLAAGLELVPRGEGVTPSGATTTSYGALTRIGASYGVTSSVQAGGEVAIDLGSARRSVVFGEAAVALSDGELAAAVRGALGFTFAGTSLYDARVAVPLRWRVTERFAVTSDDDHVVVTLDGSARRVFLRAPVGVAYQLTDAIYATAGTRLVDYEASAPHARWLFAGDRYAALGVVMVPSADLDIVARAELVPDGGAGTVFVRWRL